MNTATYRYTAYGLVIESEFELTGLPKGMGEPEITVRRGVVPFTEMKASPSEQFIFNDLAGAFRILNGREIVAEPRPGGLSNNFRTVLLGRVMAAVMRQRGWLPLHASAVLIGQEAVLFLGPSGAGKSTMAATLHARGHQVITDDVAPVRVTDGECRILPTWPRLRLSPESLQFVESTAGLRDGFRNRTFHVDKFNVDLGQAELPRSIRVRTIYVLDFASEPSVEVLSPMLATATLSLHSFIRLPKCDADSLRNHLAQCTSVAAMVPVVQLMRLRALDSLPNLAQYIEGQVQK